MKQASITRKKYNKIFIAFFLGWCVATVGDMSDSVLAGLFVSEEAVAVVELVSPIFNILVAISLFIAFGSDALFSSKR